jgi:hypothetical protein
MITMKDPALTVYPNRQQMLDLIRARAAVVTGDSVSKAVERRAAASETPSPFPNCIVAPV